MYVNGWSLAEPETMCHGYSTALYSHGIKEFGNDFNGRFGFFLGKPRGWSESAEGSQAIRRQATSDQAAFDLFFELLKEFKAGPEAL